VLLAYSRKNVEVLEKIVTTDVCNKYVRLKKYISYFITSAMTWSLNTGKSGCVYNG